MRPHGSISLLWASLWIPQEPDHVIFFYEVLHLLALFLIDSLYGKLGCLNDTHEANSKQIKEGMMKS